MTTIIGDTAGMIAGMSPELMAGAFDFCTLNADDPRLVKRIPLARAVFQEAEGTSLILPVNVMKAEGFAETAPMAQITLNVFSSLEGVGLTAAVAQALAAQNIACNMVAAFHHDHAFVPLDRAEDAMAVLRKLAAE